MKRGLKIKLLEIAKKDGYISFEQVEEVCRIEFYRLSTALTMLRKCCREDKGVKPVLSRVMKGKYIIGFEYIGTNITLETRKAFAQVKQPSPQSRLF